MLRDGPNAREAKSLLGTSFRAAWADKIARDGYTSGSGADPSSPKSRMAATMQHYVDHIEQVPVIVLVCLMRYRKPSPEEGASLFPACQNLLLAARALGYGGALTGMHHGVEPELRALLGVPDDVAMSACITLGVPAGHHGPVRRKPLAEVVYDDAWGAVAGVGRRPARHPPHQVDRVRRPRDRVAVLGVPAAAHGVPDGRWSGTRAPVAREPLHRPCDTPRDRWRSLASGGWGAIRSRCSA